MIDKKFATVSAAAARALLLDGQGMLTDPSRRAGPVTVHNIVQQLGFVQVDSIQKIERAHHLILGARIDGYRAEHLDQAAFRKRVLFEHWTHDASFIPIHWFHHWQPRFKATEARLRKSRWFTHRLGVDAEATLAHVYDRVVREGALRSSDFERTAERPATGWWDWTPEKAALEFLWHTGKLAISNRDRFQKIYDLTERVFPETHGIDSLSDEQHIEWACRFALERLGVATPGELAAYFAAISIAQATTWCKAQSEVGSIAPVLTQSMRDAKPRKGFALLDWQRRVRHTREAPDRIRLLAPFDPIVRDRDRALRLFDFEYRFEAFVPAAKRRYGYYVLPILEGDTFVGRLDPRHDRERATLVVEKLWWESKVSRTQARKRKLHDALGVLAAQIGATKIELPRSLR